MVIYSSYVEGVLLQEMVHGAYEDIEWAANTRDTNTLLCENAKSLTR